MSPFNTATLSKTEKNSWILADAIEALSAAEDISVITQVVAKAARELTGADGATFVLREDDKCFYANEDAVSPLWKGSKFPMSACISGWSMLHREAVILSDIYQDARIPKDAYRPTFVKSLCVIPIRPTAPIGAIGTYWSTGYVPNNHEVKLLKILANNTAVALENIELRAAVGRRSQEKQNLEVLTYAIAHDLKNPLAALLTWSELLQKHANENSDEQTQDFISKLQRIGLRLNGQIDKMLALFRLNNRRINRVNFDLSLAARETLEAQKLGWNNVEIQSAIESGLEAFADPDLIQVVLENLFSNALKYSSEKSVIRISFGETEAKDGNRVFFVRDNGAGFEPEDAQTLFQPLVRLNEHKRFSGNGIGLASVAKIIELHGGKLWAEGKTGLGATFYFTLPQP